MREVPKPGDRVFVPFGGYELEGEVTYVNDIFDPPMVQVEFYLDEHDSEPMRNLYDIDRIRPVTHAA